LIFCLPLSYKRGKRNKKRVRKQVQDDGSMGLEICRNPICEELDV